MLNRIKAVFHILAVFFVTSWWMSCSQVKTAPKVANMPNPAEATKDLRLKPQEVEKVKRTRLLRSRDGQQEIYFAASSYQNLKTTPQNKPAAEKPARKDSVATATPVRSIFISNAPVKDSTGIISKEVHKEAKVASADTAVARHPFSSELAAGYLRKTSILKKFTVVVGSFSTLENAYQSVMDLKKKDYKALIVQNEEGIYRVITGTFNSKDNAEIFRLSLNLDYISSWVWVR